MAAKKKTSKTTNKKEKELEEKVKNLEENLQRIENEKKLEESIKDLKEAIKEDLQQQLIDQNKFGKQFDDMIENYLYFVELKERLRYDLDVNGIRYKTTGGNGFTTYKANESYERLIKTTTEMRKILQDLELKEPDGKLLEATEPKEGEGDDLL